MPSSESSTSSTSLSLIRRVRQFDPDAWNRLSRLYNPVVYHWCRRAGLQDSDAADVVQEVFRALASGIASFASDDDSGGFRGWLWGITRNKLADHHRKAVKQPHSVGGASDSGLTAPVAGRECTEVYRLVESGFIHSRMASR
jgi:RNA polymerase sigma-70 factor (ECF subfamily)